MLVLDANLLIRALLGKRVRQLFEKHTAKGVRFYAPDVTFADAEKYLQALLIERGKPIDDLSAALDNRPVEVAERYFGARGEGCGQRSSGQRT